MVPLRGWVKAAECALQGPPERMSAAAEFGLGSRGRGPHGAERRDRRKGAGAERKEENASLPEKPEEGAGETFSLKGRRVLLAEDNLINMEIATEILTMQGVEVIPAEDGVKAVEAFQESAPFSIDAILMDMQMPKMDGCEAAKRIRALHRPDSGVPIIAVTANAFTEDIAATSKAGMDAHISKPIDFNILCRTLESLIDQKK